MNPLLIHLFFFLSVCNSVFAGNDSLVKFGDLKLKNEAEKYTLSSYQTSGKNTDIIDLFLSHYTKTENFSSVNVHQEIEACVKELKEQTKGQDEAKRVKTIYKQVHRRFLKVYNLTNSFSDIFENGQYNCLSGSALYAIILQALDIPYQIIEAPQHVYMYAYPNTHRIAIETTLPENGYFSFSDAFVQRYVKYIYESKMISQSEYESNTPNQLFEKYYFQNNNLTVQGLAAAQYANYAVYYVNENNHDKALEEIKKAYYIDPSQRNSYLLQSILWNTMSNRSYKEKSDVKNLSLLCRVNANDNLVVSNEKIKYEFSRLTEEQLISNSNFEEYTRSFELVNASIKDTLLKKDIAFNYHYEMARLGLSSTKKDEQNFGHLKAAYAARPKHADLHSMIKNYFSRQVENESDMPGVMKMMDDYATSFDFLNEDGAFNSVKANVILELAYQDFMLNEISKGEKQLTAFETLSSKSDLVKPNERYVERAYSTIATYYYKKGNRVKTQHYLKTGLIYAPQNFGLKMRLNQSK